LLRRGGAAGGVALLRAAALTAIAALALVAFVPTVQRLVDRMIFQPSPGVDLTPEALGIEAESLHLPTEDGVRIHAFHLPAGGASRAVLFLHGNAGNASHRLPNAAALAGLGAQVLLLDYRGYGLSEGSPSEAGVYADARAGLAHLVETRGIPEGRVVLFGRSVGGAVAVDLAQDRALAGVILESTFTSLSEMARRVAGPLARIFVRSGFDVAGKISRVRAPLLFFHGDRDEIVDYRLGQRLFEVAPAPKHFETISGAGHNDTVEVGGREYFARIGRFLDEVAPPSP
jgi:fermentation-respiration switch protein FrsA (DUF1100 family)